MAFGPFENYAPPGVYTRTKVQDDTQGPPAGNRVPVFVGTGSETLYREDLEMVRGSSTSIDQRIVSEDVNDRFITDFRNRNHPVLGPKGEETNTYSQFRVRNYPIVTGDGSGRATRDVAHIVVTVDGEMVSPLAVDGQRGIVTLQVPPQAGTDVRVTYYFNREDTLFEDDVSAQVSQEPARLQTKTGPYDVGQDTNTIEIEVDGAYHIITLEQGTSKDAGEVAAEINGEVEGLATVETDNRGRDYVVLKSEVSLRILGGTARYVLGLGGGARTERNRTFQVFQAPIVDGTNGGITTNDPADVEAFVDGQPVKIAEVNGREGKVTLETAPPAGGTATVIIRYYHNTWQDTFDYLPDTGITGVENVGISPGRRDFTEGEDFIVDPKGRIIWGSAATVDTGEHTPGGDVVFGDDQVKPKLVDDQLLLEEVPRWVDRTVVPARVANNVVVLGNVPTLGNALDTELGELFNKAANQRMGVGTYHPSLVKVYHGVTLEDALAQGEVSVLSVDPSTRQVTLAEEVPGFHKVWATYYYNRIQENRYTLAVAREEGGNEPAIFTITSEVTEASLLDVRMFPVTITGDIEPEVKAPFHVGTRGIEEIVTITFKGTDAQPATFVNGGAAPYDFYAGTSSDLDIEVNGADVNVDLTVAAPAILVSGPVPETFDITQGDNDELKLVVDGNEITVTLGAGNDIAGSDIAGEISGVLSGNDEAHFVEAGENSRFIVITGGEGSDKSILVGAGSANSTLGFVEGTAIYGTEGAINRPASITSGDGTYPIGAGDDAIFKIEVGGRAIEIDLAGSGDAEDVKSALNSDTEFMAIADAEADGDKIIITAKDAGPEDTIIIGDGTANQYVGFEGGERASRQMPTAQDVVAVLNKAFEDGNGREAFATEEHVEGEGDYVRITTITTGEASSIVFKGGGALKPSTGFGVAEGEGADGTETRVSAFDVRSNKSGGSEGHGRVGQTYTDGKTGLRFTIPAPGDGKEYGGGDTLELVVSKDFESGRKFHAIPGVELEVTSLEGVVEGDTAIVNTYKNDGYEPGIGDFYYLTYEYEKTDYETRLFTRFEDVRANYGSLSVSNPLSLAAYLAMLNGAVIVGCKQVRKAEGGITAPSQRYIEALEELGRPLEAGIIPDILVPLSSDPTVMGAYVDHADIQSSQRYRQERRCIFGVASGTVPRDARNIARSLNNERTILVYPDSAIITIAGSDGLERDFVVDGTYIAAALAGSMVSPEFDVATPVTRRTLVGFRRLNRRMDEVEKNRLAESGITVMEDRGVSIQVRDGLTTNMESRFTSTPSIIAIMDHVHRQTRSVLEKFVGMKFLSGRTQDVELALTGLLNSLVEQQIIAGFQGVRAEPEPNDPTTLRVSAFYAPIFPLKYISITYTVGSSSSL